MIADGDSVARNAFRIGLRVDTPLPVAASVGALGRGLGAAGVTQELDPNDILEVQDMAEAIARAEMLLASPAPPRSSRPDMFEALGRRATDDTAGPATPAPPYASLPTPIPPPLHAAVDARIAAPTPTPLRYVTMPSAITGAEDDAFYHPVGRMRSLADVTLDGYRPEPTLLVRAATRRKRFSWIMAAFLFPLLVLAAFAIFASTESTESSAAASGTALVPRSPTVTTTGRTPLATTSALTKTPRAAAGVVVAASPASATPVFDVNSLPSARPRR
ncbi:MAG: hypothetical protein QOI41_4250 [Myxococcales bacterium]|nr:hypothetical protein [Myxococcales bacterium]